MSDNHKDLARGIVEVFTAIFLWGVLPLYWKQLTRVPSDQIIANRIIWSFLFVFMILILQGRMKELFAQLKKGKSVVLYVSGIIITLNWFTYIYAVNSNQIIEASLGYYINPLLTIFLGRVVLKEKLNSFQLIAVVLAAIGVGIITFSFGRIPLIAVILALTFSAYSLVKKRVDTEVVMGLSLETLAVLPLAIGYLLYQNVHGQPVYSSLSLREMLFILGTGIVTAIPLLLFSDGAKKVPLTTVGFIQYLSPTMSLLLGIYLYHESFTWIHILTFSFIWTALLIYSFSQVNGYARYKKYHRL
ncbi:MAG: EamA family transporter RarD [Peptococcaceae bacterium]|nr:EamA family transporter RarD [Peptococcaceae bacterium]